jgi:hypothetical protein
MVFENYEELTDASSVDMWRFELSSDLTSILVINNPNRFDSSLYYKVSRIYTYFYWPSKYLVTSTYNFMM